MQPPLMRDGIGNGGAADGRRGGAPHGGGAADRAAEAVALAAAGDGGDDFAAGGGRRKPSRCGGGGGECDVGCRRGRVPASSSGARGGAGLARSHPCRVAVLAKVIPRMVVVAGLRVVGVVRIVLLGRVRWRGWRRRRRICCGWRVESGRWPLLWV